MVQEWKTPSNVVYWTKEKLPNHTDKDKIDEFKRKSSLIKRDDEKSWLRTVPSVKPDELNAIQIL